MLLLFIRQSWSSSGNVWISPMLALKEWPVCVLAGVFPQELWCLISDEVSKYFQKQYLIDSFHLGVNKAKNASNVTLFSASPHVHVVFSRPSSYSDHLLSA